MHLAWRVAPLLALVLGLGACGAKKRVEPLDDGPDFEWPPGFTCPFGAEPAGRPPPLGLEIWCQARLPSGRWQKNGPYRSWHANEQYAAMGQYDHDRKSGTWTEWYANGKPASETTWINGVLQGRAVEFYSSGQKKSDGEMVDGTEDGPWTYWSQDGGSTTTGSWVLGRRDGEWLEYDAEGQVITERVYRNGRLIRQRSFQ
jgi:hypothetical protein